MRLSRLKRANVPYIANDVQQILAKAPGAPEPALPPTKQRLSKLARLDANISKCSWCGGWTWKTTTCNHCQTHGYPIINDDIERPA